MTKTIIVTSTQYPGFGGGATNSYAIIMYLRKVGYRVYGIFFCDQKNVDIDPKSIGNIYRIPIFPFINRDRTSILRNINKLNTLILEKPDIILSKNYLAPILAKILYPNVTNIYIIAGLCNVIDICNEYSASSIINNNISIPQNINDVNALNVCDLIVTNSPLTHEIFVKSYPQYNYKLYSTPIDSALYIKHVLNYGYHTDNKIYDIMISASILSRPEKNIKYAVDIFNDERMTKYNKIIIGGDNHIFNDIINCTILDMQSHMSLCEYISKSKILLVPSLYDSNPNIVREAQFYKCIPIVSNNIGYYDILPAFSICKSYDPQEWIDNILYVIDNYDSIIDDYNIQYPNFETDITDILEKY